MGLVAKTIKLDKEDIEFALGKGRNLSDGIRKCIYQCKNNSYLIQEIKSSIGNIQLKEVEMPVQAKSNFLKLMEDD